MARTKRIWGIILILISLGLALLYFVIRNQTPTGPLLSFVNSLFPASMNSPGEEQRITLRMAKLWQIIILMPSIFTFSIGLSLLMIWDPRPLIKKIFSSLPTPIFLASCSSVFFAVALWVAYVPMEGIPHIGDDIVQVFQARILARGFLSAPAPDLSIASSFPTLLIIVRNGFWHGVYPIGHAILMVPFVWLRLEAMMGPVFGVLRLLVLYGLARQLLTRNVARLTILLYLLCPFTYMISSSPVYHNSDLLIVMIFLWGFLRSRENRSWFPAFLAGLAAGYGSTVRPILPVVLGASALTFLIWDLWRHQRTDAWWRGAWMAVGAIPGCLLLLWTNYVQNGSPLLLGYEVLLPGQSFGFGPNKYLSLYGTSTHTPLTALYNLLASMLALSTTLQGWPLISLFPAVLGLWITRKKMANWLLFSICVYTATMQAFHLGSSIILGPRHYFVCVASLLILGTQGLVWLYQKGVRVALATSLALILLTIQAMVFYAPPLLKDMATSYLGVDGKVTHIAEREVKKPALVFVRAGIKAYYNYQSGFLANSPWLDNPIIYAQEMDAAQNKKTMEHFPDRIPYVFVCQGLDDLGTIYPYYSAPPPQPNEVVQFSPFDRR